MVQYVVFIGIVVWVVGLQVLWVGGIGGVGMFVQCVGYCGFFVYGWMYCVFVCQGGGCSMEGVDDVIVVSVLCMLVSVVCVGYFC